MADILYTIDRYIILVNLIVFLILVPLSRQALSCFVSISVLLLMNAIMVRFEIELKSLYTSYPDFVREIWFFTFGLMDAFAVILIYQFHNTFGVKPSYTARLILTSFIFLGFVQALAHFDRFIFHTQFILDYYLYAIPAVNIGIAAITFATAFKLSLSVFNRRIQGAN